MWCAQGPLPLEVTLLGERAMRCRAYAKALHYKEDEFHNNKPGTDVFEALIRYTTVIIVVIVRFL